MKLAILTGGGDVPGLNACLKALVNRAIDDGHEVVGIRRGWAGLLQYNPQDDEANQAKWLQPLDKKGVSSIDRMGGTFLHSSRLIPSKVTAEQIPSFLRQPQWQPNAAGNYDFTAHIKQNITEAKVDAVIAIGGDDTLHYAQRLHGDGVPLIAIPKTMDNDVYGTDYCIGFSTGITRSVNFIQNLRASMSSHERLGVVELFGRNSGEMALISAYLANVDRAIISEVPFDPEKLATLLMKDKKQNPQNYAIMTISQGAAMIGGHGQADGLGHKKTGGIGAIVGDTLRKITGENIMYQQIGYLMRSGEADSMDLMVGFNFVNIALDLIQAKKWGQLVAVKEGKYTHVSLDVLAEGIKRVDVDELYDVEGYRPKLRHVNQKPMFLY